MIDREDLSIYEKMIYIVLARYSNEESSCFPSYKTISEKAGCSIRQVSNILNELENKELIIRENRNHEGKKEKNSNLYFLISSKAKVQSEVPNVRHLMPNPMAPGALHVRHLMPNPMAPGALHVRHEVPSKKTYNKKTYIKSNTTTQKESKTDYLDLSFLDLDIEKVKLTKDEYDKLISKFGKKYIHDKIVSLENYIVNGKGSRYKSHYRALLTWGNGDVSKGIVSEVTKAKNPLSGFKEL
ncbi:TPA: helix-turn-helix domain-containing protein [Clostridioides difficile]|nr:helix-turn-helix domain-containing protein [Clostridioides difficile]